MIIGDIPPRRGINDMPSALSIHIVTFLYKTLLAASLRDNEYYYVESHRPYHISGKEGSLSQLVLHKSMLSSSYKTITFIGEVRSFLLLFDTQLLFLVRSNWSQTNRIRLGGLMSHDLYDCVQSGMIGSVPITSDWG